MKPEIREIRPIEYKPLGKLMVDIYTDLEGFPTPEEQPKYYEMLSSIGEFNEQERTTVLVAVSQQGEVIGGVVYFGDMAQYGSGGTATTVKNASGIRLLGVDPSHRGEGIGKTLTLSCLERAREKKHKEVVLHTTASMKIAWGLYESMGFKRSDDLDFMQGNLKVFGFRLALT